MKILVLQLARYGDILLTWPTLQALREKYPSAELHLLVRERFAEATEFMTCVDKIWKLPSAQLLKFAFENKNGATLSAGLQEVESFLGPLSNEGYQEIINLSFSPLSSYLTHYLYHPGQIVRGYTRHSDGYFNIPDDASAYFSAQVGIGKPNRYHLVDIFAAVAEVDLTSECWSVARRLYSGEVSDSIKNILAGGPYAVVHIGASQESKSLSVGQWVEALRGLLQSSAMQFVLVGVKGERWLADEILQALDDERCVSLVDRTQIKDLFPLVYNSEAVLGCDSLLIHIASLCDIRTLNLSFSSVNFWETGPRGSGSLILWTSLPHQMSGVEISKAGQALLEGTTYCGPHIKRIGDELVGYKLCNFKEVDTSWHWVEFLYTGSRVPQVEDRLTWKGLAQLRELCEMALEQINFCEKEKQAKSAVEMLNRIDELIPQLYKMAPEMRPLVSWFETERLRIPPGSLERVIEDTRNVYSQLKALIDTVVLHAEEKSQNPTIPHLKEAAIAAATYFRSNDFRRAQQKFSEALDGCRWLTDTLVFLRKNMESWSEDQIHAESWQQTEKIYGEAIKEILDAYQKSDYVLLADLLEYDLSNCLDKWLEQLQQSPA